ncbi:hypothetical protein [Actinomadura parmotrematis]|uniref:Major facilitator superfamily (MFS) profile domain-containing protein n=1 Tax=Actinomadura parmotrematis TaxID=2864039 RepID=A0ABS7FNG2_9ACTN|nr:hypothetical protein [Actinomadura parmotrematis]MBW8481765.1 hypothetical protein [Actinomadura parmotrematis]
MARTILTIAGIVLAVWLLFTVLGWVFALLKFFLFVGIVAVIVMLVVKLVAKSPRT